MKTTLLVMAVLVAVPTVSDADPTRACQAVCGKISSCKLMSYSPCMKMCFNDPGADDPSTFAQAKLSCKALANQMAPSGWLCTAEGTSAYGYNMDGNVPDEYGNRDVHMLGSGPTRDVAATNALRDCGAIMGFNRSLHDSTAITSACHITQCIPPARQR